MAVDTLGHLLAVIVRRPVVPLTPVSVALPPQPESHTAVQTAHAAPGSPRQR